MSKIIGLGDLHGSTVWKDIVEKEKDADKIVFVGDYVDSFNVSGVEQLHNLKEVVHYKKSNMDKVVLLLGNHDYHYCPGIGQCGTSGYQQGMAYLFGQVFTQEKDLFQMAHKESSILFSHAGIGHSWLISHGWEYEDIADYVNDIWKHKPLAFMFDGIQPNGDDVYQTPIWIRPKSLAADTSNNLAKSYTQVFGHTRSKEIVLNEILDGKLVRIDAIEHNQYLIIDDGVLSVGKI